MTADLNGNGQDEVIGSFKGLGLLMRHNDESRAWRKIGPVAQGLVAGASTRGALRRRLR